MWRCAPFCALAPARDRGLRPSLPKAVCPPAPPAPVPPHPSHLCPCIPSLTPSTGHLVGGGPRYAAGVAGGEREGERRPPPRRVASRAARRLWPARGGTLRPALGWRTHPSLGARTLTGRSWPDAGAEAGPAAPQKGEERVASSSCWRAGRPSKMPRCPGGAGAGGGAAPAPLARPTPSKWECDRSALVWGGFWALMGGSRAHWRPLPGRLAAGPPAPPPIAFFFWPSSARARMRPPVWRCGVGQRHCPRPGRGWCAPCLLMMARGAAGRPGWRDRAGPGLGGGESTPAQPKNLTLPLLSFALPCPPPLPPDLRRRQDHLPGRPRHRGRRRPRL